MEILIPQTLVWVWVGLALVLMPVLGVALTKLDLEADSDPYAYPGEEKFWHHPIVGAALIAWLWPLVLGLGVVALILIFPTWYLVTVTKTRHMRRKREAATEKEVLAKIEADRKAEDERIKREIDGADPMGFDPEPVKLELPHPRAIGRLRKSQNAEFLRANMKQMRDNGASHEQVMAFARLARQERLYWEVPKDEIPSTLRRVNWL